jgi:hypothetical protein
MGLAASHACERKVSYQRHRPEATALYEVVRDNLETLYGAIDDGALDVRLPKHAKKELEAFLDCGLLCRGFARVRCLACDESRLVAFSCKGRGFCPSCLGRRMCAATAQPSASATWTMILRPWAQATKSKRHTRGLMAPVWPRCQRSPTLTCVTCWQRLMLLPWLVSCIGCARSWRLQCRRSRTATMLGSTA